MATIKPKKIMLKNGLRIILVPKADSLAASVLILVEAGSEYESKRINGLSHFLEHMMFKGTTKRPRVGQISEEFAALGAQTNAFTTQEYTGYWAKAAAKKLPKILDIVSDLYLNPVFDPKEIDKERGVIIEEINMYEDTPSQQVWEDFMKLAYGDQPAGWSVAGEKDIIRKLNADDFLAYRAERYVPQGTVVIVAGKFNVALVRAQIEKDFAKLQQKAAPKKTKTKEAQSQPEISVSFKDSGQSHIALGFRAFSMFDSRRYAIQVLADVLGGSAASRLFKKVREEMGAAYYVSAEGQLYLDHGLLTVAAGIDHAKTEAVLAAVLAECKSLRDDLVPADELQRSKDHMTGQIILGLETSDELASYYGAQEILSEKFVTPDELVKRIQAVTAAEVRKVARDVFKEKGMNLAVIGPYRDKAFFNRILKL